MVSGGNIASPPQVPLKSVPFTSPLSAGSILAGVPSARSTYPRHPPYSYASRNRVPDGACVPSENQLDGASGASSGSSTLSVPVQNEENAGSVRGSTRLAGGRVVCGSG